MWHDVARASITWWNSLVQSFPERLNRNYLGGLESQPLRTIPSIDPPASFETGTKTRSGCRTDSAEIQPVGPSGCVWTWGYTVYHPRTIETSDMMIKHDKPIGTHIFLAIAHFWAFPYNAQAVFPNLCCFPFIKSFEHWSLEGAMPVGWVKSFWTQACLSVYSIPPKTIQCTWFMIHLISSYIIVYSSLHYSAYQGMS